MHTRILRATGAALALILASFGSPARGDEITLGGVTHKDVLVYKGSAIYYVKFPKDGRIINVAEKDLAPGAVVISDDPFQRDELKAKFTDMKEKRDAAIREAGGTLPADSPFNTAIEGRSESMDTAALLGGGGGGGGGKGLGVPRAALMQLLQASGFTFGAPAGNSVSGQSADGKMSIELQGPESGVSGVVMKFPAAMAPIVLGGMGRGMGQAVPWIGEFLTTERANLAQGQAIERTQDGAYVSVVPSGSGPDATIVFTVRGA